MACTVGGQIIPQLNVEEATEDSSPSRSTSNRRSKTSFSPFSSRKHQRLPGTQGQHALVKSAPVEDIFLASLQRIPRLMRHDKAF